MSNIKIEKHYKKVDEDYYKKVGKKLIEIREGIGYTQRNVALALGVTFQQYQKYESGVNRIPTKALAQFCELTGSDIREIAGVTLEDYEIRYKQNIVNHYNSTYINNFNGLFSNLFNMDLKLMKNRIAVGCIILALIIYFIFALFKFVYPIYTQYNGVFLSLQMLALCIAFSVVMFVVFSYNWLTYLITFIAYSGIYGTLARVIMFPSTHFNSTIDRVIMYIVCIVAVYLTFYILKKCQVNMPKKEEGPEVIDMRRRKGGVPE